MRYATRTHLLASTLVVLLVGCRSGDRPREQAPGSSPAATAAGPSEQEISDAYVYLLGRLLGLRQQQLDFKEGFKWNELVHRKPGEVPWANPNLDVACSEARVAIDETSCLMVSVPKVEGRHYTVQFLNGWGETVANLNERLYPQHADGDFAVCLEGSAVEVPTGAQAGRRAGQAHARAVAGRPGDELERGGRAAEEGRVPPDGPACAAHRAGDRDVRDGCAAGRRGLRLGRSRAGQRGRHQSRHGEAARDDARDRQGG